MLPTKWDGRDIVVMDQVIVKGPGYRSEDCRAGKEAGSALARVKKVVSKFSVSPLGGIEKGCLRVGYWGSSRSLTE